VSVLEQQWADRVAMALPEHHRLLLALTSYEPLAGCLKLSLHEASLLITTEEVYRNLKDAGRKYVPVDDETFGDLTRHLWARWNGPRDQRSIPLFEEALGRATTTEDFFSSLAEAMRVAFLSRWPVDDPGNCVA